MSAKSACSEDKRSVLPTCSVLQQNVKLAAVATRSVAAQTEDPSCGGLSLWDWLTPTAGTSTATQTTAGDRYTNGAQSRGSIGWSCRKCSIMFSPPSTSGGTPGDRRALTLTFRQRRWNRRRSGTPSSLHSIQQSNQKSSIQAQLQRGN